MKSGSSCPGLRCGALPGYAFAPWQCVHCASHTALPAWMLAAFERYFLSKLGIGSSLDFCWASAGAQRRRREMRAAIFMQKIINHPRAMREGGLQVDAI